MISPICIIVTGEPVPKQSTRFVGKQHIHAHTPARVAAWQQRVAWAAREVMQNRHLSPLTSPVALRIVFNLGNNRRVDLDNLSNAVCDALNGIVFLDDSQIVNLHLIKQVREHPNVWIEIHPESE